MTFIVVGKKGMRNEIRCQGLKFLLSATGGTTPGDNSNSLILWTLQSHGVPSLHLSNVQYVKIYSRLIAAELIIDFKMDPTLSRDDIKSTLVTRAGIPSFSLAACTVTFPQCFTRQQTVCTTADRPLMDPPLHASCWSIMCSCG